MLETLALIALSQVFRPIVEDIVKDAAGDFAKDFCKGALQSVFAGRSDWNKASAKALTEFVLQFQEELVGAGEDEDSFPNFEADLKGFVKDPKVRELLGSVLVEPEAILDARAIASRWAGLGLRELPLDFEWKKLCRRYTQKARGILNEFEELRELLKAQNIDATARDVKRLAGIAPGFDLRLYRDGLRTNYGNLKLESLDGDTAHQPMKLWNIFVEQNVRGCQEYNPRFYELPKEYQFGLREDEPDDERSIEANRLRETYFQQTTRPVTEVLRAPGHRLCVVLGDPGAGKSVLLQFLALQWAQLEPSQLATQPIPLLIELKTYAEDLKQGPQLDFLEYLDGGIGICGRLDQHELHAALGQGSAYFLFDGLDEIFDAATRGRIVKEIVRLTGVYPSARFVVTSRVIGYQYQALRDAEFQHFMLQDLEPGQIESFIERWHRRAYADERERAIKRDRLKKAIDDSKSIRELACNPLLLTLMALLNRHQELPRDRTELYEGASRLLLQQWDASRALGEERGASDREFDYRDKQAMLRMVARQMQTGPQGLAGNVIARDELEACLAEYLRAEGHETPKPIARRLIEQLRARNFILCFLGEDLFAFVHRTFLEFFCASDYVRKFERHEITREELYAQTFEAHWQDETWHEVLRLIVSQVSPELAGELIEGLMDNEDEEERHLFLAAQCLSDVKSRASLEELSERLREAVKALVCRSSESEKFNPYLVAHAVATVWPDSQTLEWLYDCARNHEIEVVRCCAIYVVAELWPTEAETLSLILEILENDSSVEVRSAVIDAITEHLCDVPAVLPLFRNLAKNDGSDAVRASAVDGLTWMENNDQLNLYLFRDLVQNDESERVRCSAAIALTMKWHDDPNTLLLLLERAQCDKSGLVRFVVIKTMLRQWQNTTQALSLLKELAESDADENIRSSAVNYLSSHYRSNPEVQAFLDNLPKPDDSEPA